MVNVPEPFLDTFAARFGSQPEVIVRSPGRVNLIGEHTDYNEGFVMPVATEQGFWVAAGRRGNGQLAARSEDLGQEGTWDLAEAVPPHKGLWSSYVRGVAAVLRGEGYPIGGTNLLISGDLPVGSGLSSSAALEVGVAIALLTANDDDTRVGDRVNLAHLCRKAEHEYAGVPCGIMDQYACLMGQEDRAILLDCRSITHEMIPMPADWRIVILDTQVRHSLASGEYALRQKDCRRAVEQAGKALGRSLRSLRDLDEATLRDVAGRLDEVALKRARHVATEDARVVAAGEAFRKGDGPRAGQLMYASHTSLRDDYQVSCRELDLLVDIATKVEGVYGARMTGGGFGGCAVAIATEAGAERLLAAVARHYNASEPKAARVILTGASDGAKVWRIS
jgi:galactokinase